LFTFTIPFAFAFTLALLGLAFTISIALPVSFENASVTVPFTFTIPVPVTVTVAIKRRIAPSHEGVRIWEGRPSVGRRKTGGAGANADAKIRRYASCALAGGHKLCSEARYFLFVLLAYFSVLSLEVIEALTDDVEFVDLTGD
jgi:hypothetical protein